MYGCDKASYEAARRWRQDVLLYGTKLVTDDEENLVRPVKNNRLKSQGKMKVMADSGFMI